MTYARFSGSIVASRAPPSLSAPIASRSRSRQTVSPGVVREEGEVPRLRHQQGDGGVGEHVRQAVRGIRRVQRHVRAARAQHAQQRDDQVRRALQAHAHARIRIHPARPQVVRERVRPPVQLRVRQRLIAKGHGDGIRRPRGLRRHARVHGDEGGFARGGVPSAEHRRALRLAHDRQRGDGRVGARDGIRQQRLHAVQQANQPLARVAVAAQLQARRVGARLHHQVQVERLLRHPPPHDRDADAPRRVHDGHGLRRKAQAKAERGLVRAALGRQQPVHGLRVERLLHPRGLVSRLVQLLDERAERERRRRRAPSAAGAA